jgi:hypothetical protein
MSLPSSDQRATVRRSTRNNAATSLVVISCHRDVRYPRCIDRASFRRVSRPTAARAHRFREAELMLTNRGVSAGEHRLREIGPVRLDVGSVDVLVGSGSTLQGRSAHET